MKFNFKIEKGFTLPFKIDFKQRQILNHQQQPLWFCPINSFPILSASNTQIDHQLKNLAQLFNGIKASYQIVSYDDGFLCKDQLIKLKKFVVISSDLTAIKQWQQFSNNKLLSFEEILVLFSNYFDDIKQAKLKLKKHQLMIDDHQWQFLLAKKFEEMQNKGFLAQDIYHFNGNYSLKVEAISNLHWFKQKLLFNANDSVTTNQQAYAQLLASLDQQQPLTFTYQLAFKDESIQDGEKLLLKQQSNHIHYRQHYFSPHLMLKDHLPINYSLIKKHQQYTIPDILAYGYPFYSEQLIDEQPHWLLGRSSNTNEAIIYNNFSKTAQRMNANELILGNSGSGKTSLMMKMIYQRYKQNFMQYIVDVEGGQLTKLTKALKGMVVDGVDLIINPLQIRCISDQNPYVEHMHFLRSFFKAYNNQSFLSDWHYNYLENVIDQIYERYGLNMDTTSEQLQNRSLDDYPLLSEVYAFIDEVNQQTPHPRYEECLSFLKPLTKGVDALLFNQHTNFVFNNKLVCFDLSSLDNTSEQKVLKCQYFNILSYIWSMIVNHQDDNKYQLYFDEFNVLLDPRFPDGILFLQNLSKRIRKYHAAITCATQQVEDLFLQDHHIGEAILGNSCNQFLFAMHDLQQLVKSNIDNEEVSDQLANLTQGTCLLKVGNQYQVFIKVVLTNEEKELFDQCEVLKLSLPAV